MFWLQARETQTPLTFEKAAKLGGVTDAALIQYMRRKPHRKVRRLNKIKEALIVKNIILCNRCKRVTDHSIKSNDTFIIFRCDICKTEVTETDVEML